MNVRPSRLVLAACVVCASSVFAQSGGIDPFAQPSQPSATQPGATQPGATKPSPASNQPGRTGATVDLRPKLEKGKVFRFKMSLSSTEKTTPPSDMEDPNVPAEPVTATQDQELVLKLTVKDSNPETGSTLELVYESLKMKITNPMLGSDPVLDFDSTKADDPNDRNAAAAAAMLGSVVGATLTVSMDKDGNVTNVASPATSPALADGFTGKDVISGLVGQVFSLKKGEPKVRVGEKWTNDAVVAGSWGRTRVTTNNTLTSHRGGVANIAIDGAVSMEPNSPGQAISITIRNSRLDGNAVWSTEEGMLDSLTFSQTIDMDVTTPVGNSKTQANKRTTFTRLK